MWFNIAKNKPGSDLEEKLSVLDAIKIGADGSNTQTRP